MTKLVPMLADVHDRLSGVVIERLPWPEILARYDRPGTLFYLDPPYWGSEGVYGAALFSKADFEAMAEALKGLKGHFLMSLNDAKEVRACFAGFRIETVRTTYTVGGGGKARTMSELLISGRR